MKTLSGTHGVVGGNLFLGAYLLAMLTPCLRLFSASSHGVNWIALIVIVITGVITVASVRAHGGGAAGEPLGCLAGALVWLGRFAGPAMASRLAPAESQPDLWRVVGGSLPPVLMALALWFSKRGKAE
jgi:hypothetical protein